MIDRTAANAIRANRYPQLSMVSKVSGIDQSV